MPIYKTDRRKDGKQQYRVRLNFPSRNRLQTQENQRDGKSRRFHRKFNLLPHELPSKRSVPFRA